MGRIWKALPIVRWYFGLNGRNWTGCFVRQSKSGSGSIFPCVGIGFSLTCCGDGRLNNEDWKVRCCLLIGGLELGGESELTGLLSSIFFNNTDAHSRIASKIVQKGSIMV